MRHLAVLLAACAVAVAGPAHAGGKGERRLRLPTEWTAGSQHRYRVSWERRFDKWQAPGPAPRNTSHSGEIAITVVRKSKAGYVLRWEPAMVVEPTPPDQADTQEGGTWLWRRELALPLELRFEPGATAERITLLNEDTVREELAGDMRDVMRVAIGREAFARMESECGQDPKGVGCASLDRPPMAWTLSTAAVFECAGQEVDLNQAETWQGPHPNPDIGEQVAIEYRREVVAFDPGAPVVRIKSARQPNAAQMRALMAREMARLDASTALREALGGWNIRFEVDCTMDRRSGWPVKAELRATGAAEAMEGIEIVRFERVEPAAAAPAPNQ